MWACAVAGRVASASMTIAIFLPSLRGGGAERAVVTLANGLAAKGLDVTLVAASSDGEYWSEVDNSVKLRCLNRRRIIFALKPLVRYLRNEKPKVLISALSHANVVAVIGTKLARAGNQVVVSERATYSTFGGKEQSFTSRVLHHIIRPSYLAADGIVAVSAGVAEDFSQVFSIPRNRITVIHNPVVTDRLRALATAPVDNAVNRQAGAQQIVAAGRLINAKGFDTLLRAFALLLQSAEDGAYRLIIMGDGPLRGELEQLCAQLNIHDKVHFAGFVDNPFAVMRSADVFVLSSRSEGLPNVLIQAMACGTPVVATDCPSGPREILEDGQWGELVPVDDAPALANALKRTLFATEHPDVRQRAEFFSVERAVNGYLRWGS